MITANRYPQNLNQNYNTKTPNNFIAMELKQGYKNTEVGIIPEDWEVKKLEELINYIKGYPFQSKDYTKDGTRIIRVSDTTFDGIKHYTGVYINYKSKFEKWLLREGDLIISTVGSKPPMYDSMVGKVIFINSENTNSLLNQNAVLIRNKLTSNTLQKIILNNLRSKRYIKHIEDIFRGNANQASITLNELFIFQIPLPPTLAEQTAIATALSDTDALIASLEKLIVKKQAIKQGAMQELLKPKEGWVVKKLGEVGEIVTGSTPPTNNRSNYGDVYLFVSPADLGKGKYIIDTEKKLSKSGFDIARKYPANSILFTCIGSTIGKSGISKVVLTSNQQINAIFPNDSYICDFLYYSLLYITPKIKLSASEQAVPMINKTEFGKILIPFPSSIHEQAKIATILSDIDQDITTLQTKLQKLKQLKQAQMQVLLTGKIRLV